MTRALDWLRTRTPAQLIVLGCGAAGLVFFARIVLAGDVTLTLAVLMLGLCTAWSANVAAAVLLVFVAILRLRGRPLPSDAGPIAVLLVGLLGAGWFIAGLALLLTTFSDASMLIAIAGIAALVLSTRLRPRAPTQLVTTMLLLASVILCFQIPREIGSYTLEWKSSEARWNWQTNGGENCTGMNLGDRPAAIAPYRPQYVIESQLPGTLGQLVNERIGEAPPGPPHRARMQVSGAIDYGGLGCYLPLYKTLHVTASLNTSMLYSHDFGDGSLTCSANHQISVDIDITTTGIASCRDLTTEAARHIADQLHAHARSICGQ